MIDVGTFSEQGKWISETNSNMLTEYRKANIGNRLTLTIVRYRKPRSLNQNAYMWGVVYEIISEFTGMTPNEVHEVCKLEFNPVIVEICDRRTGEIKEKIKGGSTANMNTQEMEIYLDKIRVYYLTEFGLMIPLPNEILYDKKT